MIPAIIPPEDEFDFDSTAVVVLVWVVYALECDVSTILSNVGPWVGLGFGTGVATDDWVESGLLADCITAELVLENEDGEDATDEELSKVDW